MVYRCYNLSAHDPPSIVLALTMTCDLDQHERAATKLSEIIRPCACLGLCCVGLQSGSISVI